MTSEVKCTLCEKTFAYKRNWYVHVRKIHHHEPLRAKDFQCAICNTKFSANKSLIAHTNKYHEQKEAKQTRIICPLEACQAELFTLVRQRRHLLEKHDVDIELEEVQFNEMAEFEEWKFEIEKKTMSLYVLERATSILRDGSRKSFYYCHRSHRYRKKGKDIRKIKSIGSNKIGKVCPSLIEVLENNETIIVKYWKTHCGHETEELSRVKLDMGIRIQIAEKLKKGVTYDYILDSVHDNVVTPETIQRTLLLNRQDLRNITRDFNIDYATKKHVKNEIMSHESKE